MTISKTYRGYCPRIDGERTIRVRLIPYQTLGAAVRSYKKDVFDCEDKYVCQCKNEYGECQLYDEVPACP